MARRGGGRRGGGVAAAVSETGAAAEHVQDGIDELLAERRSEGPPRDPGDLGNFVPDQERPRGPKVTRQREPQHLETAREEQVVREVTGGRRRRPAVEDEAGDEEPLDAPGSQAAAAAALERPAELGDEDDDEDDDVQSEAVQLRERLAQYEERELARDAQLQAVLQRLEGGGGQPFQPGGNMGQGVAADPRAAALIEKFKPENILPFKLTPQLGEKLGLTPEGTQTLDAMLRMMASGLVSNLVEAYTLDQQMAQQASATAAQQQARVQQAGQAFLTANPDLEPWRDLAESVSIELATQYPHLRAQPAEWIRHTATLTRKRLAERGVRLAGGAAPVQAAATGGLLGGAPAGNVRSLAARRPAPADFGTSRGGVPGRKLSPLQNEMLELMSVG